MLNWRKPILKILLKISGQKSYDYFKEIKKISNLSNAEKRQIQNNKLKQILIYSYKNIPYYKKILEEKGVVNKKLEVNLNNFSKLPILNKEILRKEFENLQDKLNHNRKTFSNTSGGSTGEPVKFIQDNVFWDWVVATKFYFSTFFNKEIGEKELRLWGSERDLLIGKDSLSKRLKDWLYNRVECNSFKMSENYMKGYIEQINSFKPKTIEAYVQSIYELAKFAKENDIKIYSPKGGILTSAGTLYPDMEKLIREVFNCKVKNRYGSREVGDIACSRDGNENLEINILQNYVEILDDNLNPVKSGETGKIYITTLNNFSMPLIRYEIGDIGIQSEKEFEIKRVEGRVGTLIKTSKGVLESTALTTSFYNLFSIKKYQFIQETEKLINIKIVINDKFDWDKESKILKDKLLIILGNNVEINFIIEDDILSLDNGKYLYFISKVK